MENAYSTEMTFVRKANNGHQLVFEDEYGYQYKMSTKHFRNNMSPRSRNLYTTTNGFPIEGKCYSIYLYHDTQTIALDKNVYLWECSGRGNKSNSVGEAYGNLGCSIINLGFAIWDYIHRD